MMPLTLEQLLGVLEPQAVAIRSTALRVFQQADAAQLHRKIPPYFSGVQHSAFGHPTEAALC